MSSKPSNPIRMINSLTRDTMSHYRVGVGVNKARDRIQVYPWTSDYRKGRIKSVSNREVKIN
jgi:hypothetical protein